ncbi:MAG: thiol-disulfide isomerase/thioredoxin [Sphingobacteriales bacterium]|jgi:thiol-disulfide isomerase/thioredoxin
MFQELTEDNLSQIVQGSETTFVQFSAGWCGNCRVMKPKFKRFAAENETANFVVADAEKFPLSRKLATVDNLPTFAAFKNGELVKQVQTNKVESLKDFINEVTGN